MSHVANDLFYENRQQWLDELGRTEGDVMEDGYGEFVFTEDEDGFKRVDLPDNLQMTYGE